LTHTHLPRILASPEMYTTARPTGDDGGDTFEGRLGELLAEVARSPVAPSPALEPVRAGQRLAHFRIDFILGAGGMGIVYAAEDLKLGRKVALKVLPAARVADVGRRRRFLREARTASAVLHPNLATVFEVGESEGTVFIALERVEGVTLRKLLEARGGRLPPAEALRIAREITRGAGKAHAAGIVHRDIKPENVMVTLDGGVKVLDFGLAKLAEARDVPAGGESATMDDDLASTSGRILGTPGYMSPEQASGGAIDARSDVFAVGVVLYEMLGGARPFPGRTLPELRRSIEQDAPRPLRGVPKALARAVDRCLRKAPAERFADCGELGLELDRIAGSPTGGARTWAQRIGVGIAIAVAAWAVRGALPGRATPDAKAEPQAAPSPTMSKDSGERQRARIPWGVSGGDPPTGNDSGSLAPPNPAPSLRPTTEPLASEPPPIPVVTARPAAPRAGALRGPSRPSLSPGAPAAAATVAAPAVSAATTSPSADAAAGIDLGF
jgi:serine/threonine-protein kinase